MPRELSPFELDLELARVWPRVKRTCRAIHEGELEREPNWPDVLLDPETIDRLVQDRQDPIAAPLLRSLYRLEVLRRELPHERKRVRQYRFETHALDAPLQGHFTLRQLLGHSLKDAARRPALLDVLIERSGGLRDAGARAFEARSGLPRFGNKSRDELELPVQGLPELSRRFLEQSRDAFSTLAVSSVSQVVEVGLAHGAADGWPRRLDLRELNDLLGEPSWLKGLTLELGELPAPVSPASFLRGFLRLGVAFTEALAPRGTPFSLARDPFGLSERTHGALLALLVTSPPFLARQLGLGRERALGHSRALSRSALLFSRRLSLKFLLRNAALEGTRSFAEAFSESTSLALGFEVTPNAAGVLFRPAADDGQRVAGLWLAATRYAELTRVHDDDWFRNPRAIEQLRAEAAVVPNTECSPEALVAGSRELLDLLSSRL